VIEVACGCGARLAVPAALAGQEGRCPGCGRSVRAAERRRRAPAPPPEEPEPPPYRVVRVGCRCGRSVAAPLVRVRRGAARCPTCDRRLALEA